MSEFTENTRQFYKKYVDIFPFIATLASDKMNVEDYQAIIELLTKDIIFVTTEHYKRNETWFPAYEIHKAKDLAWPPACSFYKQDSSVFRFRFYIFQNILGT